MVGLNSETKKSEWIGSEVKFWRLESDAFSFRLPTGSSAAARLMRSKVQQPSVWQDGGTDILSVFLSGSEMSPTIKGGGSQHHNYTQSGTKDGCNDHQHRSSSTTVSSQ